MQWTTISPLASTGGLQVRSGARRRTGRGVVAPLVVEDDSPPRRRSDPPTSSGSKDAAAPSSTPIRAAAKARPPDSTVVVQATRSVAGERGQARRRWLPRHVRPLDEAPRDEGGEDHTDRHQDQPEGTGPRQPRGRCRRVHVSVCPSCAAGAERCTAQTSQPAMHPPGGHRRFVVAHVFSYCSQRSIHSSMARSGTADRVARVVRRRTRAQGGDRLGAQLVVEDELFPPGARRGRRTPRARGSADRPPASATSSRRPVRHRRPRQRGQLEESRAGFEHFDAGSQPVQVRRGAVDARRSDERLMEGDDVVPARG